MALQSVIKVKFFSLSEQFFKKYLNSLLTWPRKIFAAAFILSAAVVPTEICNNPEKNNKIKLNIITD